MQVIRKHHGCTDGSLQQVMELFMTLNWLPGKKKKVLQWGERPKYCEKCKKGASQHEVLVSLTPLALKSLPLI